MVMVPLKVADVMGSRRILKIDGRQIVLREIETRDASQFRLFTNSLAREKATNPGLFIIDPERELTGREAKEAVSRMRKAIDAKTMISVAAFDGPRLVGACEVYRPKHDEIRHTGLLDIAILPGHRGIGLGELMMKETLMLARRSGIWLVELRVFATNVPAIRLYEKMGFKRSGLVPDMIKKDGRYIDDVQMYVDLAHDSPEAGLW